MHLKETRIKGKKHVRRLNREKEILRNKDVPHENEAHMKSLYLDGYNFMRLICL